METHVHRRNAVAAMAGAAFFLKPRANQVAAHLAQLGHDLLQLVMLSRHSNTLLGCAGLTLPAGRF
jgi:hypothetical protein